jgi:hypothetical protein
MKTEEFFDLVKTGRISDLDVYNYVQEMTDNFDEIKLNLLCDDFDFYFFMAEEEFLGSFTRQEIEDKIKEYGEQDRKIPMLSDKVYKPTQVSDFFEYTGNEFIQVPKEKTPEQKARLEKDMKEWEQDKKNILDVKKLFDPHGIEFFTLYKLRNLLVDLKREHTSATYKFDDELPKSKKVSQTDINSDESINRNKKGIDFSVLHRIIYLTDYYHHSDKLAIDELLDREITDFWELEKQFDSELQRNIVLTQSDSSLKKLIKHYLFELNDLFEAHYFNDEPFGYTLINNNYNERFRKYHFKIKQDEGYKKADKHENYIMARDSLLEIILNQLEVIILKTGLSLNDLFDEMKVSFPVQDTFIQRFNAFDIVRNDIKKQDNKELYQYINWLKSDKSLKQFIETIKEQNLIESRKTEAIINNHFKPHREQNKEPEPIKWLNNQNLLVYLFRKLYKKYLINPAGKKWQLVSKHFIKENGEQYKVRSLTVEAGKQKDGVLPANGINTIDKIIDRLIAD